MSTPGHPDYHAALTQLENLKARRDSLVHRLSAHNGQRPAIFLVSRAKIHAQKREDMERALSEIETRLNELCREVGITRADDNSVASAWKRHLNNRRPAETPSTETEMKLLFSTHDLPGDQKQPGQTIPSPPSAEAAPQIRAAPPEPEIGPPPPPPVDWAARRLNRTMEDSWEAYEGLPEEPASPFSVLVMPENPGDPNLRMWISTRLENNHRNDPVIQQLLALSGMKSRPADWVQTPAGFGYTSEELSSLLWWRQRFLNGEDVEYDPNAALIVGLGLSLGIGQTDTHESLNRCFDLLARLWKQHSTHYQSDVTLSAWCNHFLAFYRPDSDVARAWHQRHLRFSCNGAGLEVWLRHVDRAVTRGAWRHCAPSNPPMRKKMTPETQALLDRMEQRALGIAGQWMQRNDELEPLLQGPRQNEDNMLFSGTGYATTRVYRQRVRATLRQPPLTLKQAIWIPQSHMRRVLKLGSKRTTTLSSSLIDELSAMSEDMLRAAGMMVEKPAKKGKKTKPDKEETPAVVFTPLTVDLSRVQELEADSERVRSRLLDASDLAHLGVEADFSWSLEREEGLSETPLASSGEYQPPTTVETETPADAATRTQSPEATQAGSDMATSSTFMLSDAARSLLRAALQAPSIQPGQVWEGQQLNDVMDEINTLALNEIGDVLLLGDEHELSLEPSYQTFAQTLEDRQ